jgi:hypothetical protein
MIVSRVLGLLLLALLCACAHESNQDIVTVHILGRACPNCSDNLAIERGGTIAETGDARGLSVHDSPLAKEAIDDFRSGTLRAIGLEARGCYGWCPIYLVTFASDGNATIHARGPHCDVHAKAVVPFRRVLEAAGSAGAAALRPTYPIKAVDTFGARITLATAHQVFVSDGPDSTGWSPEFLATESRLDQIVRDTNWSPPLDIPRCSGVPQKLRG